jgi:hypothetical protein
LRKILSQNNLQWFSSKILLTSTNFGKKCALEEILDYFYLPRLFGDGLPSPQKDLQDLEKAFVEKRIKQDQQSMYFLGVQKNLEKPFAGLENLPKLESSSGNLFEQILRS